MKRIELKLDRSLIALAGNPFGRKVFEEQVKSCLDTDTDYCIVFPKNVEMVGSSFVQGFFNYWLQTIGLDGILKHIKVEASSPDLVSTIYANLT